MAKLKYYDTDSNAWVEVEVSDQAVTVESNFNGETLNAVLSDIWTQVSALKSEEGASLVGIKDTNNSFTSTTVEGALSELFLYADSIRSDIASTIGTPLHESDTLEQLVSKIIILKSEFVTALVEQGIAADSSQSFSDLIQKIPSGQGSQSQIQRTSKLNVTAPYTHSIVLENAIVLDNIVTSVLQYVGNDSNIVCYEANYNNNEASSFSYDSNQVEFDGYMKIKENQKYPLTKENDFYESDLIDFSSFKEIGSPMQTTLGVYGGSCSFKALVNTKAIITANADISLTDVETIDSITLSANILNDGDCKLVISVDLGATWKAYDGSDWILVDIANENDMKDKGMTLSTLNSLTNQELQMVRADSNTIRFGYYLEKPSFNDIAENDAIKLIVTMKGYNIIAPTKNYEYSYEPATKTLTYLFNVDGTYTINYLN